MDMMLSGKRNYGGTGSLPALPLPQRNAASTPSQLTSMHSSRPRGQSVPSRGAAATIGAMTGAVISLTKKPTSSASWSFKPRFQRTASRTSNATTGNNSDSLPAGILSRLFDEFRRQAKPKLLVPATLISMSLSLTAALRASLSGRLLDIAVQSTSSAAASSLLPWAGLYFAAALYSYAANVIAGILFALARWDMSMAMRQKLFKALLRQEIAFFDQNSSGALVSRLTNDTDQMQNVLNRTPETLVTNLLRCIISLVLMAQRHRTLTAISILTLPFSLFLVKKTGQVVGRYGVMQNDALAQVNAVASEAIANARAVQVAGAEDTERQEYGSAIAKYLSVIKQTLFKETSLRFLYLLVNDACTDVPLMCFACWLIAQGQLSVGQFYTFRTLLYTYRRGFRELAELLTGISRAKAVSVRYFELADREPAVSSMPNSTHIAPNSVRGVLELDDVSFRYPGQDQWALEKINLCVRPGEVVALVGASGAGKSTILRLCTRLADPQVGVVRLDGRDVRELCLEDFRSCLGVVDQDPAIFNRSVRENIAYGLDKSKPSQEQLVSAASTARAADFIEALPKGYDEYLAERGTRLSGGQRQRLAIARAVARGAPILLMDEPTSALDGVSEEAVAGSLLQLASHGCTVLVAAHRLGTIAKADRLVVLEGGRIVEEGSRQELLQTPSRYRAIVEPPLSSA